MKDFLADHIRAVKGYVYGAQPRDRSIVKLNTNENPYPPSSTVRETLAKLDLEALRRYPDATATALRASIADFHGISPDQVLITNGGDEAIRLVATACLAPNTVMVSTDPGYTLYPVVASILNARWIPMALNKDFRPDVDAARQCLGQRARLVCIPNPNAPSGVLLTAEEIDAFAARFLGPLLIDEAYVDFVDPKVSHNLVPLLSRHRHLLLLRTFSKGFALAGARVGYLLGDAEFIALLSTKVRDSYNVSSISQAIALSALNDFKYAQWTWDRVRAERTRVSEALSSAGYDVPTSQANFVLPRRPDKGSMDRTYEHLRQANILVRFFKTPRLHDRLRISIGTPSQNDALLNALASMR